MIKAILMDFNGVIINDEPIQMRAYQEILAAEDIALSDEDYFESLGMDDNTFVETAFERVGKKVERNKMLEITQAKTERWREAVAREVPLFPGIENFIRKSAHKLSLGIVSMAKLEEISHILDLTGLGQHFSIIVSAEDVLKSKPDPQCYREGFRRLDLARLAAGHLPMTHEECVAIEDAPPGIAAARAADLQALGVTNTVSADQLRAAGARWVADDLNDWMPESIKLAFA
ncbi:MAG: HAD family phosphatase [Acidobacteriota bacterium]